MKLRAKGHSYEIGARYSPLQSISVIFSNVNAWVNVGPAMDLGEQSFDLSDSSLWFPLQASSKSSGEGADAAAEFEDDEELDDPDALHIVKLPSLQSGNPKYDMKNLSRKLAIDLQARGPCLSCCMTSGGASCGLARDKYQLTALCM